MMIASWRCMPPPIVATPLMPPVPAAASGGHLAGGRARPQGGVDRNLKGPQGVAEAGFVVRRADEPGLARIRFTQDALILQHPGGGVVVGVVAPLPVAVVARRLAREIKAAHRRGAHKALGDASGLPQRTHPS